MIFDFWFFVRRRMPCDSIFCCFSPLQNFSNTMDRLTLSLFTFPIASRFTSLSLSLSLPISFSFFLHLLHSHFLPLPLSFSYRSHLALVLRCPPHLFFIRSFQFSRLDARRRVWAKKWRLKKWANRLRGRNNCAKEFFSKKIKNFFLWINGPLGENRAK